MRSYFLSDLLHELYELNNCFSHYIFVWEQFYSDNTAILKQESEKLTTDIYPSNSNGKQFNVKLKLIDSSHNETYKLILKSLFLLSYSEVEVYLRTFYEFARKTDPSLPNLAIRERIPDDIFKHLNINLQESLDKEEFLTFDYLRLRRNRLTHSGGQSKGDLAELIRQKGNSLKKYWDKKFRTGTFGLQFQSDNTEFFTKEEIFDLINIWRLLIKKTDSILCSKIGREAIINHLHTKFKSINESKIKSWTSFKIKTKYKAYCRISFDLNISVEEIDKLFGNVA